MSALVPVHNGERTLAEALESILAQTLPPAEVIVVDDGSTDGTLAVARGFAPRVTVVTQPHQGLGAARNRAIASSTGEVVAFLDADDLWPADRLRRLGEDLALRPALDAVAGRVRQFLNPDLPAVERERVKLAGRAEVAAPVVPAMLIRRAALERIGPFAPGWKVGTDMEWLLRARDARIAIGTTDEVVLLRRIHADNTGRTQRQHAGQRLEIVKAALDRRRGGGTPPP